MKSTSSSLIQAIFVTFENITKKIIILLKIHFKQLPVRVLFNDFLSVASSIGFVSIPAFVMGFLFVLLPQGRDVLLIVVEKLKAGNSLQLLFLLVSLFAWSVSGELGVRYAIAITDNSGKNLSDDRVAWRKTAQKLIAGFFLLWPFLVVIFGLFLCFLQTKYRVYSIESGLFALSILCVSLTLLGTFMLYFRKFGKYKPGMSYKTLFGARALPPLEKFWLSKLYGIYDEYIYTLPKPSSFRGTFKSHLSSFTNLFIKDKSILVTFLQDPSVLTNLRVIPSPFELINHGTILEVDGRKKGELYKWIYLIPTSFYRGLHKQVIIVSTLSFVILVIISFLHVEWGIYTAIGAPALVLLAFGCYSGIYTGLLFLDRALLRNSFVSIRFILISLFIITSYFNNDHPARLLNSPSETRQTVARQFNRWFTHYKTQIDPDRVNTAADTLKYPVIFFCSEGGALRTGAYTGLYLTQLEDSLAKTGKIDLRHSIFAMSGVSGGAVGLGFYNALAYRSNSSPEDAVSQAKTFFSFDAISPIIGKMFFGDFLNLFIPRNIDLFNRATALEKAWELAYKKAVVTQKENTNVFDESFLPAKSDTLEPLFVINTTEVETGLQCWVSNYSPDTLAFIKQRDLLAGKIRNQFRFSTALNFSSRFPLFSPGAAIDSAESTVSFKPKNLYHYVDGGYVENSGSASMLEVFQLLKAKAEKDFNQVIPIVIALQFNADSLGTGKVHFANEISEILFGIYNTRQGRTMTSVRQLEKFVREHNNGLYIPQPIRENGSSVPLNWTLSSKSIDSLNHDIKRKLIDTLDPRGLSQLFKAKYSFLKFANKNPGNSK